MGASYFQAIGEAKYALFLGLLRQVFLLVPLMLIFLYYFGLNGIWAAAAISDFISSLIAIVLLWKAISKLKNQKKDNSESRKITVNLH